MSRQYDIEDAGDVAALNRVLNRFGVHFEKDLFDHTYVWLELIAYIPDWKPNQKRKKRKNEYYEALYRNAKI